MNRTWGIVIQWTGICEQMEKGCTLLIAVSVYGPGESRFCWS